MAVLFKGRNFARLLEGLGVTIQISVVSVALSIVIGVALGLLMTVKKPDGEGVLPAMAGDNSDCAAAGFAVSGVFRAGAGV